MDMESLGCAKQITEMAKKLFAEERNIKSLDAWFRIKQIQMQYKDSIEGLSKVSENAFLLKKTIEELPLDISDNAIFAGTQRDGFARSYALINPSFKVESFSGYCDPIAVFKDIEPDGDITEEKIQKVCDSFRQTPYIKSLGEVYGQIRRETGEAVFFVEQVTGHIIPDMRYALKHGVKALIEDIKGKICCASDCTKKDFYEALIVSLETSVVLAGRYASIASDKKKEAYGGRKKQLELIENTLGKIPKYGADNLYEAIQSFILLWQIMCIEQSPNPFAFSVGNADRIFEPYRKKEGISREEAASILKHFLVFFNVGDRSWAISQNLMISGRDMEGNDLTNETSYAFLDAYSDMNLPQPILSVKLHKGTPDRLYRETGKLLFTPGCLTPSFFNDDSVFIVLKNRSVDARDLSDYSIAGCQEPLIMGKDNGNTTNSWLNLAKILELSLNDGKSLITGKQIGERSGFEDSTLLLKSIRELFFDNVRKYVEKMVKAANNASIALAHEPVPFLSVFMGGVESGYDMRDAVNRGTEYNGSGCLIHGLSVVSDSFVAIDRLLEERPEEADNLVKALKKDFEGYERLRQFLLSCPKYGNNHKEADKEAVQVADIVSDIVSESKNYLNNPFRPDFSTPSTHLLYGHWVGAMPSGRKAKEMLNYGVDPLYGDANSGMGFRVLSVKKLPFEKMTGGYASHFGIDPKYFRGSDYGEKGIEFKEKIMEPLFFCNENDRLPPFYLYVNVTTPETLRKVLKEPEKYAPGGIYIMRIHGTFVNFLDLSSDIQEDIIRRLDLQAR